MTTEAVNALCISAETCWCFKSLGPLLWIALQVYNSLALEEIYHQKLHRSVFCPGNHKAKAEEVRNTLRVSRNENVCNVMHFFRSTYLSCCFPLAEATSALKSVVSCYILGFFSSSSSSSCIYGNAFLTRQRMCLVNTRCLLT